MEHDDAPGGAAAPSERDGPVERIEGVTHTVVEDVERTLSTRVGRIVAGFLIMIVGIALLPLPIVGPGWILLLLGLSMLPFTWAQRATRFIRRHIPGIPEDGRIPARTWIVAGVVMVVLVVVCSIFGPRVVHWVSSLF